MKELYEQEIIKLRAKVGSLTCKNSDLRTRLAGREHRIRFLEAELDRLRAKTWDQTEGAELRKALAS